MQIPKKLKIGGHLYKIELVDGYDIGKDCGESNPARNSIKIAKDLPQSQLEETLIHEVLHAINGDLSEKDVHFLSMAIYQVLVDNKLI